MMDCLSEDGMSEDLTCAMNDSITRTDCDSRSAGRISASIAIISSMNRPSGPRSKNELLKSSNATLSPASSDGESLSSAPKLRDSIAGSILLPNLALNRMKRGGGSDSNAHNPCRSFKQRRPSDALTASSPCSVSLDSGARLPKSAPTHWRASAIWAAVMTTEPLSRATRSLSNPAARMLNRSA